MNYSEHHSALTLTDFNYQKAMGSYKPRFEGMPEDYYPLTCWEVIKYSIVVLLAIFFGLGLLIGFIYWILKSGTVIYIDVWVIIFLVVFVIIMIMMYNGGRDRIR